MQLATLDWDGGSTAALRVDEGFRPIAGFPDVGDLVASGPDWQDAARSGAGSDVIPHEQAALRRPVLNPGAVICVGVNFRAHVLEMGAELPDHPTLFSKLSRALTDPGATIQLPAGASRAVDYEGELAVVIGSGGRDIAIEDAWEAVAGLTIANDVSMRDYQFRSQQWFAGKTWESSTPVGPTLVTLDEVGDVSELELRVEVNGEPRQHSRMGDLIFSIPELIADVSQIVTLQPGDLLLTGTPSGVAHAMEHPDYLRDDDLVAVTIDRLGTLSNRVRAATLTAIGDETQDHR